jgi:TonB family protein
MTLALLILFLTFARSARADGKPADASALFDRMRTMEDLRGEGSSPFSLRVRIHTANDKSAVDGAYGLTWFSENRWHEELRLGSFSRVRDGVDGGYRQIRSQDFQPQVIFDIDELLNVAGLTRLGTDETAGKPRTRKIDGAELWCVETHVKGYKQKELCFDPATGLLLQAKLEFGGDHELDYTGAVTLGAKRIPAQMKSRRRGELSVDISVEGLDAPSGGANSLPVPDPARSEFWGRCNDPIPGTLAHQTQPIYPEKSKSAHDQGMVKLYARIDSDGSVSHLRALSAPSVALAQASLDAVAQWKYTPTLCGNTPAAIESIITVEYSLGN